MNKIKLFEEFFWQTSDNDIANKIINILQKGINTNKLTKEGSFKEGEAKYHYVVDKNEIKDIDPLGEEIWENDIIVTSVKRMSKTNLFNPAIFYEIFLVKGNKEFLLKTNKASKIYGMFKNAWKSNQKRLRNADKEEFRNIL